MFQSINFNQILTPVLIALLTSLTVIIIKGSKDIAEYIKSQNTLKIYSKYIKIAEDLIHQVVQLVSQTYVDELKKNGKFDKKAQDIALQQAITKVKEILSDNARVILKEIYGDLDKWIISRVEMEVRFKNLTESKVEKLNS